MNSYAWGGERLEFNRLQLPKDLLGKKLTLIAGEQQRFQLFDENDNLLAEGVAGEAFANDGVEGQIAHLSANPGTRFQVVRNPRIVTIQGYQDALDISEQGKESGIIRLALASSDAAEAVKILNKIASLYVEQNVRRTSAEAAQSLAFLQSQLPQVKRDLAKASDALNAYQTHGKTVNISLETQSVLGQSVALETRISELKMQQAELDRKFTKQHPAYRALMTQIGELTQQQKSLEGKVQDLPATQQELLNLTRDVEVASQIYTQLLNKSQELDIVRAGAVGNVRLIDTADVDLTNPIKPKKPLIVLIATLLGAFVGVALVLLRKSSAEALKARKASSSWACRFMRRFPTVPCRKKRTTKGPRPRWRRQAGVPAGAAQPDRSVDRIDPQPAHLPALCRARFDQQPHHDFRAEPTGRQDLRLVQPCGGHGPQRPARGADRCRHAQRAPAQNPQHPDQQRAVRPAGQALHP